MVKINDKDMEVIMHTTQEDVIRKMLKDRFYCLIKLPTKKPDKIIGKYSSSIFVSHMNSYLGRSLAIRDVGSKSLYEECEYYLCVYRKRGHEDKSIEIFKRQIDRCTALVEEATYPSVDELITFLNGKELFLMAVFYAIQNNIH